jgi:hypothetical protein
MLFSLIAAPIARAETANKCLQFNGNSYAQAPSKLIPVDKDFTVEMWVYSSTNNNGKFAEFISQGTQPYAFYIGVDPNGQLRMGDIWMDTGIKLPTNIWTHIALTHTATDALFLYVNGEIIAKKLAGRSSYNSSGNSTRMGAVYWETSIAEFFTGCLDEVRFWDTVRTPQEIADYKDVFGISTSSRGLIASYSFDTITGFYNAIRKIYPDTVTYLPTEASAGEKFSFSVVGQTLSAPSKGSVISNQAIENCFMGNKTSAISSLSNIPKVLKVNGRDIRQTSVDLLINGLPSGACVGADTFLRGTTEPINSTVGIVSEIDAAGNTPRFRMNIDSSSTECSGGTNNKIEVRLWWSDGSRYSTYSAPFMIPDCFGTIPASSTSLLSKSASVSLIGTSSNASPWAFQTSLRLKSAGLAPAATRTSNVVTDKVQDLNGCHGITKIMILQKVSNGVWVDVGDNDEWANAKNCDAQHPYQPVKKVSLADTTVLRWKVSNGSDWEMFSTPFIHVVGSDGTKTGDSSNSTTNNSSTTQTIKLEQPTNISLSLIGNEIIIKVVLPSATRSYVQEVDLVSSTLGYPTQSPLVGKVEGAYGVFRIPSSKIEGKTGKHTVKIDSRGTGVITSRELTEEVDLSKMKSTPNKVVPKVTGKPKTVAKPSINAKPVTPKPSNSPVSAIKCSKGSIVRTFLAAKCPPGWKNA